VRRRRRSGGGASAAGGTPIFNGDCARAGRRGGWCSLERELRGAFYRWRGKREGPAEVVGERSSGGGGIKARGARCGGGGRGRGEAARGYAGAH
jgi:hypothetical protein